MNCLTTLFKAIQAVHRVSAEKKLWNHFDYDLQSCLVIALDQGHCWWFWLTTLTFRKLLKTRHSHCLDNALHVTYNTRYKRCHAWTTF